MKMKISNCACVRCNAHLPPLLLAQLQTSFCRCFKKITRPKETQKRKKCGTASRSAPFRRCFHLLTRSPTQGRRPGFYADFHGPAHSLFHHLVISELTTGPMEPGRNQNFETSPKRPASLFTGVTETPFTVSSPPRRELLKPEGPNNSRAGRCPGVWSALLSAFRSNTNRNCCLYEVFQPIRLKTA